MNILHVINVYFVLPYFIGEQLDYFRERGHHMHVICSHSDLLYDYCRRHKAECYATQINKSFTILDDLRSILRICRYIRQHKIDIVVGHTPKGALLSMLSAWLCRVPKRLYFRHGLVYETSSGFMRTLLIWADRITSLCATQVICVSPSVMQQSLKDKLSPANKQIILSHGTCNGIDTHYHFNPALLNPTRLANLRAQYDLTPDLFVIGYTGRLVRDKGIEELIQAFYRLPNLDKCRLLLVGIYEDRDALSEEVKHQIETDPRIIHTGYINQYMEYYYALMNVYVLPSYREGFPTGVLEAQSMELPIITTRATGCIDSIQEGITGLFVNHTPIELSNAIQRIRTENPLDAKQGRRWVETNFDCQIIWKEIEKLY